MQTLAILAAEVATLFNSLLDLITALEALVILIGIFHVPCMLQRAKRLLSLREVVSADSANLSLVKGQDGESDIRKALERMTWEEKKEFPLSLTLFRCVRV